MSTSSPATPAPDPFGQALDAEVGAVEVTDERLRDLLVQAARSAADPAVEPDGPLGTDPALAGQRLLAVLQAAADLPATGDPEDAALLARVEELTRRAEAGRVAPDNVENMTAGALFRALVTGGRGA